MDTNNIQLSNFIINSISQESEKTLHEKHKSTKGNEDIETTFYINKVTII
jgi:hypothetical protein